MARTAEELLRSLKKNTDADLLEAFREWKAELLAEEQGQWLSQKMNLESAVMRLEREVSELRAIRRRAMDKVNRED